MKHFDVVVVGAGSAGELIANDLAESGLSVALVEKLRVGGECSYVSCVPSKAMLKSARVRDEVRNLISVGASSIEIKLDSDEKAYHTATHRRDLITKNRDDSAAASNSKSMGVTLFRDKGIFINSTTLQINNEQLSWSDLVLTTGSHVSIPEIAGIDNIEFWTSDMALSESVLPKSVVIIGGGPVGCELAQIYSSFGAETKLLEFGPQLANKEHPLIVEKLAENLTAHGVSIYLNTNVTMVEKLPKKQTRVHLEDGSRIDVEQVILATGRKPTTTGFNLEALDLIIEKNGAIAVDDHCRAAGKTHIWAAGDVTAIAPFTHTANYQGKIIVDNIKNLSRTASYDAIPRAIYTDPPVVSVGRSFDPKSPAEIVQVHNEISRTARFLTDGGSDGLVILLADLSQGILVGASAIGPHADEWMSEVVLAVHAKIPIVVLAEVVHGFPTFGEVLGKPLRELAMMYNNK